MNPVAIVVNGIFIGRLLLALALGVYGAIGLLRMIKDPEGGPGPIAGKLGAFIGLGLVVLWGANQFVGGPSFGEGLTIFADTFLTGSLEDTYLNLPTPPP